MSRRIEAKSPDAQGNLNFFQNARVPITFVQVLGCISVLGPAFLGIMALAPFLVEGVSHLPTFRGFAGTSVLILVGSATDTARKVQVELVSQKYKTIEFYDVDNLSGPK